MTPFLANASTPSLWRRAGASLALAAALTFALQPTLVLAQAADGDNQPPPKAQPKPPKAKLAKKASRTSPTDHVSDDLNRREAERAAGVVREMSATPASTPVALPASNGTATGAPQPLVPPAATAAAAALALGTTPIEAKKAMASEPPTVAAIPPRSPVVSASLTPTVNTQPGAEPAPVAVEVTPKQPPAPKIQEAQARPPAPGPAPVPGPSPVPVQPPTAGNPPPPSTDRAAIFSWGSRAALWPARPWRLEAT